MNILLALFHWIVNASLRASLLAVAILLLQAALRSVISARSRYVLWLPVLLVLTLPVLPQSRWSAENLFAARTHAPAPVSAPVAVTLSGETSPVSSTATPSSMDWKEAAAAIVWAAGAVLSLGGGLLLYSAALRRFLLNADQPDDSLTRMIASLSTELRLHRAPRVILSPAVESPAVTGLLRPLLLLPANFSTAFDRTEARLVLKHELMHLKRFDLQLNALLFLLNTLHWFNPVLWLAAWCARQDRETACDAQVLAAEASDCRGDYGRVLLKAESARYTPWLSIGFVGIFEPGRILRSRIKAIAGYRRPGPLSAILAAAAILLLAVLGATHAQTSPPAQAGAGAIVTVPAKSEAVRDKLNHIIIPTLDFHDATIRDVVNILNAKSAELDTTEPDPSRRGVKIILWGGVGMAEEDVAHSEASHPRVTFSLSNVSVLEALKYVCQLTNLMLKVEPFSVMIVDPNVVVTKEYRLAPSFASQIAPGQAVTGYLTANGAQFPPGASAIYFPTTSVLVVHNTWANLDLVDAIVKKFPAPPAPTPVPGTIQAKLAHIVIPSVEFHDTRLRDVVDYLKQQSIQLDTAEPDPSRRGVNIITLARGTPRSPRITLSLKNIPLIEALRIVCQLTNLKLRIDPSAAVIVAPEADQEAIPPGMAPSPPNSSVTFLPGIGGDDYTSKDYWLLPSFASQMAPGQTAMDLLMANGVQFPRGASAVYLPNSGRLIVHNTAANLELVDALTEKFLTSAPPPAPPTPTPVPGSIEEKLNRIIIPKIEYKDATIPGAIDFLRQQSIQLDTAEPDPSRRGVKITLAPGTPTRQTRLTLTLTNIPLLEALKFLCQLANLKMAIGADGVLIRPPDAPTPPPAIP
jgi:beta-lactamase regulating signal transducer with metallopeptidase domain